MPGGWMGWVRNALCAQGSVPARAGPGSGCTGGVPQWERPRRCGLSGAWLEGQGLWEAKSNGVLLFPFLSAQDKAFWLNDLVVPSSPGWDSCILSWRSWFPQGEQHHQSSALTVGELCPSHSIRSFVWSAQHWGEQTSKPLLSQALIHIIDGSIHCFVQLKTCLDKKYSFKFRFW